MAALGKQVLIELKDCDAELLNDIEYLRTLLTDVARSIGATVIKDSFYQFTPQGISGVVIIAESHVSIHTWPEFSFAAIDVFTCGDVIEPKDAVKPMADRLKAKSVTYIELKRGVLIESKALVL